MKCCSIFSESPQCCRFLYVVFLISSLFCGVVIFFLGCWFKISLNKVADVTTYLASTVPTFVIILGIFIILQGFIGFVCINNPKCLLLYAYCLLCIFAVEFFICLTVYYYSPDVNDSLSHELKSFILTYKPNSQCCRMMDEIQTLFQCCGNDNSADWLNSPINMIPQSCCKRTPCDTNDKSQIYSEGCRFNIKCLIMEKKIYLQTVLFPAAFMPFFGTAITFFFAIKLNRLQYERMH